MSFYFPVSNDLIREPRLRTTAYAYGHMADTTTNIDMTNITGTFTMWYNGITPPLVNARAMTYNPSIKPGWWLRCTILDTELSQSGLYQWEMRLTSQDGAVVFTDTGDFGL